MLEYGINRTGKIVEIEPVDQDIVRWIGNLIRAIRIKISLPLLKVKRPLYDHANFTEKGNYSAEIKDGVGLVQTMDEGVTDQELHHDHP